LCVEERSSTFAGTAENGARMRAFLSRHPRQDSVHLHATL
jgi:hypothetical protein